MSIKVNHRKEASHEVRVRPLRSGSPKPQERLSEDLVVTIHVGHAPLGVPMEPILGLRSLRGCPDRARPVLRPANVCSHPVARIITLVA